MKVIFCDKCRSFLALKQETVACKCGRISGKYNDDRASATIWYKSKWPFGTLRGARILAIDSHLIQGYVKQSMDYVFDWKHSGLTVYHNGKLIQKTPEHYSEDSILAYLKSAETISAGLDFSKRKAWLRELEKLKKYFLAHFTVSKK